MAELVRQGKVRYLGLSEAAPATMRRARAPCIRSPRSRRSTRSGRRDPEDEILPTCRELGIGFVAYSPLGRGFLTGRFQSIDDLPEDDYRRNSPRFQGENFQKNLDLVKRVEEIARREGCTPSPARAGLGLAQGKDIVPIFRHQAPRVSGGESQARSTSSSRPADLEEIDAIAPLGVAAGASGTTRRG